MVKNLPGRTFFWTMTPSVPEAIGEIRQFEANFQLILPFASRQKRDTGLKPFFPSVILPNLTLGLRDAINEWIGSIFGINTLGIFGPRC